MRYPVTKEGDIMAYIMLQCMDCRRFLS